MGLLTTHVLDTANGSPAAEMKVELHKISKNKSLLIKTVMTNSSGRCDSPLLTDVEFEIGTWVLIFHTHDYFASLNTELADPPFLDQIAIRFSMAKDEHYHVPLLVSPWSYSTYRGS